MRILRFAAASLLALLPARGQNAAEPPFNQMRFDGWAKVTRYGWPSRPVRVPIALVLNPKFPPGPCDQGQTWVAFNGNEPLPNSVPLYFSPNFVSGTYLSDVSPAGYVGNCIPYGPWRTLLLRFGSSGPGSLQIRGSGVFVVYGGDPCTPEPTFGGLQPIVDYGTFTFKAKTLPPPR